MVRKPNTARSVYFFFFFFLLIHKNVMASAVLQTFAAKPCVQKALQTPKNPFSVLSFFFGVDYTNADDVEGQLRQGNALRGDVTKLWFGGGPEYDELCRPFTEVVRAAGKGQLMNGDEPVWKDTVDGMTAQVLLCDQLSRNIFRGSSEAFEYDEMSRTIARILARSFLDKNDAATCTTSRLKGEFYPPYLSFLVVAFMHSESQEDHEMAIQIIEQAKQASPPHLQGTWDYQMTFELSHKSVIDRFGRYPHRNKAKGRESTQEELEWLASDDLPGWAKSQG